MMPFLQGSKTGKTKLVGDAYNGSKTITRGKECEYFQGGERKVLLKTGTGNFYSTKFHFFIWMEVT